MKNLKILVAVVALSAAGMVGCGGDDAATEETTTEATTETTTGGEEMTDAPAADATDAPAEETAAE